MPKSCFSTQKEITMTNEELAKSMSQIYAKCWKDEAFKQKLLADPQATLRAEGVTFAANVAVKAVADTANEVHLVIPAKPTDLSDEDLESVAGGFLCMTGGGPNCLGGLTVSTIGTVFCGVPLTQGMTTVPLCACL